MEHFGILSDENFSINNGFHDYDCELLILAWLLLIIPFVFIFGIWSVWGMVNFYLLFIDEHLYGDSIFSVVFEVLFSTLSFCCICET